MPAAAPAFRPFALPTPASRACRRPMCRAPADRTPARRTEPTAPALRPGRLRQERAVQRIAAGPARPRPGALAQPRRPAAAPRAADRADRRRPAAPGPRPARAARPAATARWRRQAAVAGARRLPEPAPAELDACIDQLLARALPNLQLLVSARQRPDWNLPRLLLAGELQELDATHLALTRDEWSAWSTSSPPGQRRPARGTLAGERRLVRRRPPAAVQPQSPARPRHRCRRQPLLAEGIPRPRTARAPG